MYCTALWFVFLGLFLFYLFIFLIIIIIFSKQYQSWPLMLNSLH